MGSNALGMKLVDMKDNVRLDLELDFLLNQYKWATNMIMKHFQGNSQAKCVRINNYIKE